MEDFHTSFLVVRESSRGLVFLSPKTPLVQRPGMTTEWQQEFREVVCCGAGICYAVVPAS